MCLSSNLHTGAVTDLKEHPFPRYLREGYRVALNVDNTLMSQTTLTREWQLAQKLFSLENSDFERIAINAVKGAFCDHSLRKTLIQDEIVPRFRSLQGDAS